MKTILITGASRGIGLEFAKQLSAQNYRIIASCRHPQQAEELQQVAQNRNNLSIVKLDVGDDNSILDLASELSNQSIDWVINNAGIAGESGVTIGQIGRDNFLKVFNINCLGPVKVSEAFLPQLTMGEDKLVVNISSAMGSIANNERGRSYAYRSSKAALNCVMRSFAIDAAPAGIKVILLHPGWVRTDLGGPDGQIDVQTSVTSMLSVIEKYKDNSHAEVFRSYDDSTIAW